MQKSVTLKKEFGCVDFLQVVGPILVIIGHAMNDVALPFAFGELKKWIYIFHMPLFFLMSGYLFCITGTLDKYGYFGMLKNKAYRLLIPYFVWNLAFVLPKYFVSLYINDKVQFSLAYFINIFLRPRMNIWGHTWFLFALFEVFAIFSPLLYFLYKRKQTWPVVTTILILFRIFPIPNTFLATGDLMKNLIYFWIGMMMSEPFRNITFVKYRKPFFFNFAILSAFFTVLWMIFPEDRVVNLSAGVAILISLMLLPDVIQTNNAVMRYLSKNSFGIYILHWPCILAFRIVLYQVVKLPALLCFFLFIAIGILLPLAVLEVFRRIPVIKNIKIAKALIGI